MDRPPGIYASSLSRRDLARRRARMRSPLAVRAANWLGAGLVVGLAVTLAERLT
jgi:threonine/homoserine/homoserine lactone efflux protein